MRLAVLGDPVAHSRSPAIHTAALAAAGIEGSYTARRVDAAGLAEALDEIRAGTLDGANVTMPHKAAAARLADAADDAVRATGAANTLRRRPGAPGEVESANTDVGGIAAAARKAGIPSGGPVLVLGAGGSARAAIAAFAGRAVQCSVRRDGTVPGVPAVPWGVPVDGAVVVNATPLGMEGEPLPDGLLAAASGLVDLPYGARRTPAVAAALAAGIPVADGLAVLVAQAALSFTWWTGVEAPMAVMEAAARAR
ncbi:MAG: shikimate dehydrogenase [Actinobacteria bacterium]|nr:shikimate dehydrogenase [Actinomycetota bacterium]